MKKPTKKANKPAEQPNKPVEPAVHPAEETKRTNTKFKIPKRLRTWIRESQFMATTLSIILTFGTTGLVEHCQRVKDR